MSINRYLRAYRAQRSNAARRGIEFLLTFKEWCEFWGDDIDRRGSEFGDLQMQRIGDSGPYALGNIKKGTPKQNMVTMGLVRRTRNTARLGEIKEAEFDFLMTRESGEKTQSEDGIDLVGLGYTSMMDRRYDFAADR